MLAIAVCRHGEPPPAEIARPAPDTRTGEHADRAVSQVTMLGQGGPEVADIDPSLLRAELAIMTLLAVQVMLAIIAVVLGWCVGRLRRARVGFLGALVLAAAACGGTLYQYVEARESVRGRQEARVAGPYMSSERAENFLAWLAGRLRLSTGIAAATWLVGGILYFSGRRARAAEPVSCPPNLNENPLR
jgi:hypothetical protein